MHVLVDRSLSLPYTTSNTVFFVSVPCFRLLADTFVANVALYIHIKSVLLQGVTLLYCD
jgi:hypothetical protein